jgi:hypothetical protein
MAGHSTNSKPKLASEQGKSAFGLILQSLKFFTMTVTWAAASANVS